MTDLIVGVRQGATIEYACVNRLEYGLAPEYALGVLGGWGQTRERALCIVRLGELRSIGHATLRREDKGSLHGRIEGGAEALVEVAVNECSAELTALFDEAAGGWQAWRSGAIVTRDILGRIAGEVNDCLAVARNLRSAFDAAKSQQRAAGSTLRRALKQSAAELVDRYEVARATVRLAMQDPCGAELADAAEDLRDASRARAIRATAMRLAQAERKAEAAAASVQYELHRASAEAAGIPGAATLEFRGTPATPPRHAGTDRRTATPAPRGPTR